MPRFSNGLWDFFFGKRTDLGVPQADGSFREVRVTQAWVDKMIAEGKISPISTQTPSSLGKGAHIAKEFHDTIVTARERLCEIRTEQFLIFWLCDAPQELFSHVLETSNEREQSFAILQNADSGDGETIACLTQGYILWILQQFLKNDSDFHAKMAFDIFSAERTARLALPQATLESLASYRQRFDPSKMEVHPLDWPIIWLWDIVDVLIHNPSTKRSVMGPWNSNVLSRMAYATEMMKLQIALKERAMAGSVS